MDKVQAESRGLVATKKSKYLVAEIVVSEVFGK